MDTIVWNIASIAGAAGVSVMMYTEKRELYWYTGYAVDEMKPTRIVRGLESAVVWGCKCPWGVGVNECDYVDSARALY